MPNLCCLRAFVCALLSAWATIHPGMRQPCPSHSFRSQFTCYPEGPLGNKFKWAPSSQPLSDSSYLPPRTSSSLILPCVLVLYCWNVTLVWFKAVIPVLRTMSGTAQYICLFVKWLEYKPTCQILRPAIHSIVLNLFQQFFSSVTHSCPILCDPMDCSTPSFPVYHQLPEFAQTHVGVYFKIRWFCVLTGDFRLLITYHLFWKYLYVVLILKGAS